MKVSVEWLSEFVSPLPAPEELARRLTRAGLEVEGMERPAEALRGVVVARIAAAAPHPGAEKLTVTQVEAGGERLQIVCGPKKAQVRSVPIVTRIAIAPCGVCIGTGTSLATIFSCFPCLIASVFTGESPLGAEELVNLYCESVASLACQPGLPATSPGASVTTCPGFMPAFASFWNNGMSHWLVPTRSGIAVSHPCSAASTSCARFTRSGESPGICVGLPIAYRREAAQVIDAGNERYFPCKFRGYVRVPYE